jgi:Helix-turn-helix domain
MKTNALQKQFTPHPPMSTEWSPNVAARADRFPPQSAGRAQPDETNALQMYTEDEVAAMLRISLSQLRKWRTRENQGKLHGPPFKKVGRLVRYPGKALQAYINGE